MRMKIKAGLKWWLKLRLLEVGLGVGIIFKELRSDKQMEDAGLKGQMSEFTLGGSCSGFYLFENKNLGAAITMAVTT
ncbi:hypothetical protein V6N13_143774 [Hibiscus sabdariffa]|uniref:Uncharacterized protein n=1 Tax=Hibiscus sabdariffa TaxID=183260 RepID=A0ABR2FIE5_9ROSI